MYLRHRTLVLHTLTRNISQPWYLNGGVISTMYVASLNIINLNNHPNQILEFKEATTADKDGCLIKSIKLN